MKTEVWARIAPVWPLDQLIAVNPWWFHIDKPIENAAAHEAILSGTQFLMPPAFYIEAIRSGSISTSVLEEMLRECGEALSPAHIPLKLEEFSRQLEKIRLLTEQMDAGPETADPVSLNSTVVHQISQHCAAYFDSFQAKWKHNTGKGLYESWRQSIMKDHGTRFLVAKKEFRRRALMLPQNGEEIESFALTSLNISEVLRPIYLMALIESVHGWASWCAYRKWQANFKDAVETHLNELLAIRLAWEFLVDDEKRGPETAHARLLKDLMEFSERVKEQKQRNKLLWICQRALERSFQNTLADRLCAALASAAPCTNAPSRSSGTSHFLNPEVAVQAYFCIDVRSEVFRRVWEELDTGVQTGGFAGFFGLPIDYTPLGTVATRPQLPGLLAPPFNAGDRAQNSSCEAQIAANRQMRLNARSRWRRFQALPVSAFTFVETTGIVSLIKLVQNCFPNHRPNKPSATAGLSDKEAAAIKPQLIAKTKDDALVLREKTELCEKILRAMFRTKNFARLVMLIGHGSQSANNAHASALDCGACCGQTGEINARLLAGLLNEPAVRHGLKEVGIEIPDATLFLAALHNTTTDDVTLFDTEALAASHQRDVELLKAKLKQASHRCRAERARKLGIRAAGLEPEKLQKIFRARANDWSELQPEWGLANNAAFVVAPRSRTRGIHLEGRVFLHDYESSADPEYGILELIMTAPMIVTHWINMQYFASVVDKRRYGSGNKTLHNVVGGNIGVFEGNGGDLRIGLAEQSLWRGAELMHTPQRLSVYIEAPQEAIQSVIAKHRMVQNLVRNEWIFLFQICKETQRVHQYTNDKWVPAGGVRSLDR